MTSSAFQGSFLLLDSFSSAAAPTENARASKAKVTNAVAVRCIGRVLGSKKVQSERKRIVELTRIGNAVRCFAARRTLMAPAQAIFSKETFRFFKDLGRHNKKTWMDANRDRYKEVVAKPFRALLEELSPVL